MSEDTTEKKAREPKKNSIPADEVNALVAGIPQYKKTSFLVVGHKNGVRLALPLTSGVSRAYFYGNGDYSLIPQHEAITVYTEEQRKEQHKGGIMAEVEFDKGVGAAREALAKLVEVVRNAPAPADKALKSPKEPRKARAAPAAKPEADATAAPAAESDDSSGVPEQTA